MRKKAKVLVFVVVLLFVFCGGCSTGNVSSDTQSNMKTVFVTDTHNTKYGLEQNEIEIIGIDKATAAELDKYDLIITDYYSIENSNEVLSVIKKCVEAGKFVFVKDYKGSLERQTLVELFEMQKITGKLTNVPVDDGTTRFLLGYTVFIRPSGDGEVVASKVLVEEGAGEKKTESKTFELSFSEQISMVIEDVQHYRDNI